MKVATITTEEPRHCQLKGILKRDFCIIYYWCKRLSEIEMRQTSPAVAEEIIAPSLFFFSVHSEPVFAATTICMEISGPMVQTSIDPPKRARSRSFKAMSSHFLLHFFERWSIEDPRFLSFFVVITRAQKRCPSKWHTTTAPAKEPTELN